MPSCRVYLPPHAAQRIDAAARALCLTRTEFIRAVTLSVAAQLCEDAAPPGTVVDVEPSVPASRESEHASAH
jgi:hypothetical protein